MGLMQTYKTAQNIPKVHKFITKEPTTESKPN